MASIFNCKVDQFQFKSKLTSWLQRVNRAGKTGVSSARALRGRVYSVPATLCGRTESRKKTNQWEWEHLIETVRDNTTTTTPIATTTLITTTTQPSTHTLPSQNAYTPSALQGIRRTNVHAKATRRKKQGKQQEKAWKSPVE